jgi:hypothetical protein
MALSVLGGPSISDQVVDLFPPVRFYWVRRARWLKIHGTTPGKDTLATALTPVANTDCCVPLQLTAASEARTIAGGSLSQRSTKARPQS